MDATTNSNVSLNVEGNLDLPESSFGENLTLRSGTIIYRGSEYGSFFQTGHHVLIREKTYVGNHVVIGTNTVIDGNVTIGDFVKIESACYIPTHVSIGSRVFIGPGCVLTNDRYPLKCRNSYKPDGPTIEDGVTLGGNVTVLPGVTIGSGSFVAAGTLVTRDIPPMSLVKGFPGIVTPLPENLRELNRAISWEQYID